MDTDGFPKNYDSFRIFLFKKVERIALALYLTTNHLSDNVSLKTNLRTIADILIKDIILFNSGHSSSASSVKIKEDFLEAKTLLSLSSGTGLINQNNVLILLDEINRLSKEIENHKDNFIGDTDFKKSFFVVESRQKLPESVNDNKVYKGHKGQESYTETKLPNKELNQPYDKGHKDVYEQNSRNEEIMKIIKDNVKVTIKDISSKIKNVSEKTIQRELIKMVSLNLIKKEGERRWSTYSIN
ncbi:MAG: hypothetical protein KBD10_00170 [Candidatus Pacebacteria bacterium]|nr:hypothetical protein [Candidatus Paceibacterota bacterium]